MPSNLFCFHFAISFGSIAGPQEVHGKTKGRIQYARSVSNADSFRARFRQRKEIARGAGTTIIHGGTGSPGFIPVITTVALHAERSSGGATGEFDCLAFAPEATNGPHSGQLTVNAMYVVGKITGASVNLDTVTLTGVSVITGLGAGTSVPFTFIAHRGGSGHASLSLLELGQSFRHTGSAENSSESS